MRRLLPLLLIASLLAGCTSDGGDRPVILPDGSTVEAGSISTTTGAIAGVVVDEAVRPIAGARLTTATGQNATTSESGVFQLGGLEPGFYALRVSAEGFLDIQASADVIAGQVTSIKVQMLVDASPQPYAQTYPYTAYMQAWGTIGQWLVEIVNPTPLCDCTYRFTPAENVSTVILEAFWEPTVPDPAALSEFYWEIGDVDLDWYETGYCTSPCHVRPTMEGYNQGRELEVRISGPDAWAAYQQQVRIFTTVFHHGEAPEGWTIQNT